MQILIPTRTTTTPSPFFSCTHLYTHTQTNPLEFLAISHDLYISALVWPSPCSLSAACCMWFENITQNSKKGCVKRRIVGRMLKKMRNVHKKTPRKRKWRGATFKYIL